LYRLSLLEYWLNPSCFSSSGNGEFAELNKFTGVMAGEKSYQSSKPVWAEMHQED
jgi:hypothetical protein